jgi:very-short-patch-repair endonuclease
MQTRGSAGADPAIAELAGRQHGVVGRRQLLGLGLAPNAIDRRGGVGHLHAIHPGVYAVGHLALTARARWMAAVLASGPGAVLSHRTAAALWGIRDPGSGKIDVTVARKSRSTDSIRRHFGRLPDDECTVEDGIPVTSPMRTVLDLATVAKPHSVEAALREAEYLQLRDRVSLPALLARYPRHRGARSVRAALERRDQDPGGRFRSPLEELFLPFLDLHRLPRPRLNAAVHIPASRHAPERRYEVDCLWPEQRHIVELDGFESHGHRQAFEDDKTRDRRLIAHGYAVTRVTQRQLLGEEGALAADLSSSLLFYKRP